MTAATSFSPITPTTANVAALAPKASVRSIQGESVLLSPESLLYYCATQLRALDTQINKRMIEQKQARAAQGTLGELQDLMNYLSGGIDQNDAVAKERILNYYKEAYDKAPPGQKARIESSFNAFRKTACCNDDASAHVSLASYKKEQAKADSIVASVGNKNSVGREEIEARMRDIEGIIGDVNKGAELEMTNLQTLVSQRQMAVQITTNLISKLHEAVQAVVNNTK